ncbi:MAG: hypothetical protein DMG36_00870 [Acidobacteria bacterium]|nr:MAG: hypothetical protein DMG36_00870 [Acidobacteriota bacterium]
MYVNKMGLYCLFKIAHPPKITQAWSPGTKNSESWMGLTLTLIYSWRTNKASSSMGAFFFGGTGRSLTA